MWGPSLLLSASFMWPACIAAQPMVTAATSVYVRTAARTLFLIEHSNSLQIKNSSSPVAVSVGEPERGKQLPKFTQL